MTGFLNGKEHMQSRKIVIPPLIASRLHARAEVMHEIVEEHINSWKVGDEFDTPRLVGDITMDIAIYTLMGFRNCTRAKEYKQVMLDWVGAATNDVMFTLGTMYGPYKWRQLLNRKYINETDHGSSGKAKISVRVSSFCSRIFFMSSRNMWPS